MKQFWLCLCCVMLLASCGGNLTRSTEINVLCSGHEQRCMASAKLFGEKYGIKVNFVRMSTGEALARLSERKSNPEFDVWWGGPIDSYIIAKEEGLFSAYNSPSYVNLADEKYKDPDNFWVGTYVGPLAFCTNTDWLKANPTVTPPQSWADLLKPDFAGQIMIAHPATSGTAFTFVSTILQLRGEVEGWNYLHQFSDQVAQFTKAGTTPCELAGKGEAAVGIIFAPAILENIHDRKLPLTLTFPEEGTGYEIGGLAVMAGAKHLDAAHLWVDWLITPEVQGEYEIFGYQGVSVKGVTLRYPELLQVKLIDYDFIWSADHKDEFVKKFTQEIATADNLLK